MALNENSSQCKFYYTCAAGASDNARRNAIGADPGGIIKVAADLDITTAVGHLLPGPVAGYVEITLHLVEFLLLSGITFEQHLDTQGPAWSIRLQWLSALWAAMHNAGMDSGRLETIELLRQRVQKWHYHGYGS